MLLTVLAAVTVVVGMRTVGLLLISAIMIVPIAAAQQLSRSFRATALLGVVLGLASCVAGLTVSFNLDVPPGPTIVFIALGLFAMCAALGLIVRRTWHRRERVSETATAGS
jgi:zinc transport system permease protein